MDNKPNKNRADNLPPHATQFIRQVVREMGYHRKARQEVEAELTAHFEDELRDCSDAQEREQRAQRLVVGFGDAKLLAVLCRRSKKRCRPLRDKILVRSLQTAGACLALMVLYTIWFVNGKPSVKVDYLALLNRMSQPQIAEQDNAWPHYERAMALAVFDDGLRDIPAFQYPGRPENREFAGLTPEAQRVMVRWIEANQAAWAQFVSAGAKPYCIKSYSYFENKANDHWLMNVRMPNLSALRQLSMTGIWLARLRIMQGRTDEALNACLAVARAGRHWQQGGLVIEQFVGLGLSGRAHEEILSILGRQKLPVVELARVQRELTALFPPSYPLLNLEEEHLCFLDTVQHLFTEGGPGGGHLIPARAGDISVMVGTPNASAPDDGQIVLWKALSFLHAGRTQTVAKANEMHDLQNRFAKMSPYERRSVAAARADLAFFSRSQRRYALVDMLAPAVDRPADLVFRAKALHEATVTILALQRYILEKGSCPRTLDELKQAGYLDALPADPYSNGPLAYKTTGNSFTLYSFGPDFADDDGRPGTDRKGRHQMWADKGDTVFWPVP